MTSEILNDEVNLFNAVIAQTDLSAEDLLGVSPPMNMMLETPASVLDIQ